MAEIDFEDKEDIRETGLPRKNTVTAADINEIKSAVNALYNGLSFDRKEMIYHLDADLSGSDPTPTLGINTYTGNPAFTRSSTGVYFITLTDAFTMVTHPSISITVGGSGGDETTPYIYKISDSQVVIIIRDSTGVNQDGFIGTIHIITTL